MAVYSACFGLKNAVTRPVLGVKTGLKMCAGWGVTSASECVLPPSRMQGCGDIFGAPTPLSAHGFEGRKSRPKKCARKGGESIVFDASKPASGAWF